MQASKTFFTVIVRSRSSIVFVTRCCARRASIYLTLTAALACCHVGASALGNVEPARPRLCRRRTGCGSGSANLTCTLFTIKRYSICFTPYCHYYYFNAAPPMRNINMMAIPPVTINTCSLSLAENASPEHYDCQSLWVVFCGRFATITLVRRTRTKF